MFVIDYGKEKGLSDSTHKKKHKKQRLKQSGLERLQRNEEVGGD